MPQTGLLPNAARMAAASLCIALAACASISPGPHEAVYHDPIALFPLDAYDQNVDHWIDPSRPDYDKPFLSPREQHAQFDALYARYFGIQANDPSPWNPAFVTARLYGQGGADIAELQQRRIDRYDNARNSKRYIGYGQNYRPHTEAWIEAIRSNIDMARFTQAPRYSAAARAITTDNLLVRELPTTDPSYYSHRLAGEGYPFDNLQVSALRPGTPLYVIARSKDRAWAYVQTPDVQGWVRSTSVASVDEAFVAQWRNAARAAWGAVIAASAPVSDETGAFRFDAPAGTLLPIATQRSPHAPVVAAAPADTYPVLVPVRDIDGHAVIRRAILRSSDVAPMPWAATPRHLAILMKALIGRPYGWGNTGLYNDCSSELQSIFAAFGVWLPRHSSTQMSAGRMTDLSQSTPADRVAYLAQHGAPMRTLVYIGGHVMLYLGNTTQDGRTVPLVYQDIWGLRPADNSRRAIIGGSVIFPLLLRIPEDPHLQSLAATREFQISILGEPTSASATPAPDAENAAG